MEHTASLKALCMDTARSLTGSTRRLFMARTVKALVPDGQRRVARELGWSRVTVRKGIHALERGFTGLDAFAACECMPVEARLPTSRPCPRWASIWLMVRRIIVDARRLCSGWSSVCPNITYVGGWPTILPTRGLLANPENGTLLAPIAAVLALPHTMTGNGVHRGVDLVSTTYQIGVKLTKGAMARVEAQFQRLLNRSTQDSYTRCHGHTDITRLRVLPVCQSCVA
jgi:hypothetical protein